MEAMIFMMIFGAALLLTAGIIAIEKDPRQSVFLARVRGLEKMSVEDARKKARQIAKIVAIIGGGMILVFGIGLLIMYFAGAGS